MEIKENNGETPSNKIKNFLKSVFFDKICYISGYIIILGLLIYLYIKNEYLLIGVTMFLWIVNDAIEDFHTYYYVIKKKDTKIEELSKALARIQLGIGGQND